MPIAHGILSGDFFRMIKMIETDPCIDDDKVLTKVQALRPLAEAAGLSMAQMAVAWVLQNDNVASAIVGATRPEQLDDNIKAIGVVLSPELLAAIDAALDGVIERDPSKTESPAKRP